MLYRPIMPSFRPILTCFHTSRLLPNTSLSSPTDFSHAHSFPGILHNTRKPSDASHQTASRKMITDCLCPSGTGRLICNRETRASHTSPACRWSAWALRPSLHSRQSAPVRACPPRRPCLRRHRSWHSALSPLQGSRCAR